MAVDPLTDRPSTAPTLSAQETELIFPGLALSGVEGPAPSLRSGQAPSLRSGQALTVSVLSPRGRIANGDLVTLTVLVEAPALVRNVTISLTVPDGLEAISPRAAGGVIVVEGLDVDGRHWVQAVARVNAATLPAMLRLRVEARAPGIVPADILAVGAKLAIFADRVAQRVAATGGRAALGERIVMSFAANALARDADIEISAGPENADPEDGFDPILAFEAGPGQDFRAPVTLTLALSGLLGGPAAYGTEPILRYWRVSEDGRTRTAERVPARFDPATSELVARLEHFSQYDVVLQTPQDPKPWRMVPDMGGVNAFRGTSSIAIPIDVPSMQDGLEPKLALGYSSGGAERQFDTPGGAGMGWSLDTPVVRQRVSIYQWDWGETCGNDWCNRYGTALSDANDYSLSLGDQEYSLVHVGGGEFVTERYAPLRIWYCASQTSCPAPHAPGARAAETDAFWVWTEDGTLFIFGGDWEARSRIAANRENVPDSETVAWHLRYVYATYRDDQSQAGRWSVKYNYWAIFDHDMDYRLLTRVEYGNSLGSTTRHTVTIGYVGRQNMPMPRTYQPTQISVLAGQTGAEIWRYELGYGYFPDRHVLTQVTKVMADGVRMPTTTFDYTSVCIDGASPCKTATLMTRVSNGYGGSVEYA
ncbi:MAG: SpvB/TcaC N-terminal domain-containing protein, partial [Thermoflexales bacterium]